MQTQTVLAFVIAALLASAAASASSATEYRHSGCAEAANKRFPDDQVARKQFKHWCKDQWKIYKASH
jgi:hypothetical protein